jgi:uncharacterized protein YqeY
MLIEEIKKRIFSAMKEGRTLEKEILRVALGEIQTEEARGGKQGDELASAVLKKLVKSNRETLEAASNPSQKATLAEEIAVLESLLPKGLTADEIASLLDPARDAIRAAGNDGQATGIAMKHLKAQGAAVDGKAVAEAVKKMRG